MPTFTIRDLSEATAETIRSQAASQGLSTEAYVRQVLDAQAAQPVVKTAYKLRAYGDEASAVLGRDRSGINARGAKNCTQEQMDAYKRAADLVGRNQAGDREAAIGVLRSVFEEVFEQ